MRPMTTEPTDLERAIDEIVKAAREAYGEQEADRYLFQSPFRTPQEAAGGHVTNASGNPARKS